MAESQNPRKNKKSKKKSESTANSVTTSQNSVATSHIASNQSTLDVNQITVPPGLNIKLSDDNKVTIMQNTSHNNNIDESSAKKKKKSKKKSKEETKIETDKSSEKGSTNSLLNFSKNGIHLVNHPEISVTFTENSTSPVDDKMINITAVKVPPTEEIKKQDVADSAISKKKKKKKKKSESNETTVPASSSENATSVSTPTYTKVVTSDNTCVLVVNNENFSVSTKPATNSENKESKITENDVNFSIPSEKIGDVFSKSVGPDNIKLGNAVSIFPVLMNENSACEGHVNIKLNQNMQPDIQNNTEESASQENSEESKLTKAQLKAERRAKQEAQRAAKLAAKNTSNSSNASQNIAQNKTTIKDKTINKENVSNVNVTESTGEKIAAKLAMEKDIPHKARLFSHLPQCKKFDTSVNIHPAILEIGFQYSKGIICGSNARCVALFAALREIITDYIPHPDKNICRDLESNIQSYMSFLNNCRPLSVSMANAVKFLKHQINHLPSEIEVDKAKDELCKFINDFVKEEILLAKEAIGNSASAKIVNGDVILVFAHSSLIKDVLCKAHNENKQFRVIVADSRPKLEGLEMLRFLVKHGLHCSYISINAVSYVMKEVSKVIIGAHALLSNGCVMSRLGNKQIALVASSYSVPVLVCCETYKFCERVLTDSFVHNELGEPEDIISTLLVPNDSLKNWQNLPSLQLLNLLYDVTPPDLISMVITEKGVLPCTSVPVVLRVRYAGLHE